MRHEDALRWAAAAGRDEVDLSGEWVDRAGSTIDVVQEQGVLTGVFTAQREDGAITGQLSGYVQGDLMGLVVKWPDAAVTTWTGRHTAGGGEEALDTLWHLTARDDDGQHAVFAGADRFTRSAVGAASTSTRELEAGDEEAVPAE